MLYVLTYFCFVITVICVPIVFLQVPRLQSFWHCYYQWTLNSVEVSYWQWVTGHIVSVNTVLDILYINQYFSRVTIRDKYILLLNSICRQSCFDLWGLISAAQSGLKTGICQPLSEQLTHLTLTSSGTYYFWIPECSNSKERAMHNILYCLY